MNLFMRLLFNCKTSEYLFALSVCFLLLMTRELALNARTLKITMSLLPFSLRPDIDAARARRLEVKTGPARKKVTQHAWK